MNESVWCGNNKQNKIAFTLARLSEFMLAGFFFWQHDEMYKNKMETSLTRKKWKTGDGSLKHQKQSQDKRNVAGETLFTESLSLVDQI